MTNTPKLAIAIGYIDDDLVTGAIEYMPVPHKKIIHYGKQIAAVAACFYVIVTVLIFKLQEDELPPINDKSFINNGDDITDIPQITDTTVDDIIWNEASFAPEMMLPFLGEKNRIAMSSEEMFEYYGVDIASKLVPIGLFYEAEGSYPHGLYTFSDSVFDMNHFVFVTEDGMQEIEFYIGKTTNCGRYASNNLDINQYESSKVNGADVYIWRYEDTNETGLFSTLEVNECSIIVLSCDNDEQTFISVLKSLTYN